MKKINREEFKGCHISDEAVIIGNVKMGEDVSVFWFSVIRGDNGPVEIGNNSNIQENCTVHMQPGSSVIIGDNVTIGHGTTLHGCSIGNCTTVGMGSVILDKAVIGDNCIIGAASLVTSGTVIPPGHLAFGNPCKVIRPLTEEEKQANMRGALSYKEKGRTYFG